MRLSEHTPPPKLRGCVGWTPRAPPAEAAPFAKRSDTPPGVWALGAPRVGKLFLFRGGCSHRARARQVERDFRLAFGGRRPGRTPTMPAATASARHRARHARGAALRNRPASCSLARRHRAPPLPKSFARARAQGHRRDDIDLDPDRRTVQCATAGAVDGQTGRISSLYRAKGLKANPLPLAYAEILLQCGSQPMTGRSRNRYRSRKGQGQTMAFSKKLTLL